MRLLSNPNNAFIEIYDVIQKFTILHRFYKFSFDFLMRLWSYLWVSGDKFLGHMQHVSLKGKVIHNDHDIYVKCNVSWKDNVVAELFGSRCHFTLLYYWLQNHSGVEDNLNALVFKLERELNKFLQREFAATGGYVEFKWQSPVSCDASTGHVIQVPLPLKSPQPPT